jgi:hypothetical protein
MKRFKETNYRIDYEHSTNRLILELGRRGFSIYGILTEVNRRLKRRQVSIHQVRYRLRMSKIYLTAYRNGQTTEAKAEMNRVAIKLYPKL